MTSPEPARRMPPTALATCVLPWDDRLRFDENPFREHVRDARRHQQLAHGARLALRLLPPYQGATEDAYRRFEAGLGLLPGLDSS